MEEPKRCKKCGGFKFMEITDGVITIFECDGCGFQYQKRSSYDKETV